MIPNDIGADPSAPHHYHSFGKPKSMAEEDCASLCVRRVGATGDLLFEPAMRIVKSNPPSGEAVYPCYMSQWEPSAEERTRLTELLAAGGPIDFRMLIVGGGLPPVSMWLRGEDEI